MIDEYIYILIVMKHTMQIHTHTHTLSLDSLFYTGRWRERELSCVWDEAERCMDVIDDYHFHLGIGTMLVSVCVWLFMMIDECMCLYIM